MTECTTADKHCVATAARIVASKWTPSLVYALSNGPRRFCELQDDAGGVNPRTLSARLAALESEGILSKKVYPEMPPRTEYCLTQKGQDLVPIIRDMVVWGQKYASEK
ncbi:MAG TPA: helix-turn-helix domain-containing protein [Candidatus Saccharimonadales bacterium]|jgi:DNA-binding HxlR family transcriptional regulator|nr:helix-turn-helix domain-containing protein [Candidatus Saccharimonadales bacterium]